MKHLNLELAKLEKRVAPGLTLLGVNLCGGGDGTSNGSSGSCDGSSASGSKSSKSKSHGSCSS